MQQLLRLLRDSADLQEAEELASKGCKEVILIAQDVTEYGRDLYGELKLAELLRSLCRIEGLRWIRLMYCYPDRITDELLSIIRDSDKKKSVTILISRSSIFRIMYWKT